MKLTHLLPTLLLTGIVSGAAAQSFSIGPKVGANFSTFTVSRYNYGSPTGEIKVEEMEADREMLIGPAAGLMFNIGFSESFSIQPELMYSVKGYKQGGALDGISREREIKLNYIELPVLFKASAGSETVRANFMIGPYVSYLVGGTDKHIMGGTEIVNGDISHNFTEENPDYFFQKFDYGATVGAGVSFRTGVGSFLLDGRYSIGIPEATSYHPTLDDVAVRNRNSTIGISLGWLYHFPYTAPAVNDYGGVFGDDK